MAISGSMQLGMSVIGNVIGGALVDQFGSAGYYVFSIAIQTIALACFLITHPLARKLGHPEPDLSSVG
jgi:predicted MFS family arabinose efflux permease